MTDVKHDLLAIFIEAIGLESDEKRSNYLDEACRSDPSARERVEALLRAHFDEGKFLGGPSPASSPTIDPLITEEAGAQIGPYTLREEIGEGGFGVVYVAQQAKPIRRSVALKIIKPGMDTKDVIARFEAERQALALMDHPNVARVLDAGATDSGRPYFVMELVRGVPITEFCDSNHLPARERLELFVDVCHAVQHAHQRGIIHRDLKPNNIMVTLHDGKPVPKVIDFGVSKALSQQLTEKTIYTSYGQMIGTPVYMSPEQAEMSGLGVDTRSDIYSLGVLLYELLTGKTPLDGKRLMASGYAEMLRIIREEDPPRPSTRVSTLGEEATIIAQHRRTEAKRLSQNLRGELDWIVMKALDKDRERRYDTANSFAADIERFLNDEAVQACPPSTAYRFRKFARRNRALLVTACMVVAALLFGLAGTVWQAVRATQAENRTRAEGLVELLPDVGITEIRDVVAELEKIRQWSDPLLKNNFATAANGSRQKLHLSLALLPVDESQVDYLSGQLPTCTMDQFPVVRDALLSHKDRITDDLWQLVQNEQQDFLQRFRAAAALAEYAPTDERWNMTGPFVAQYLTGDVSPVYFGQWLEHFQPARGQLTGPLASIHADRSNSEKQREIATLALADYLQEKPDKLVDVIVVADEFAEFSPLIAALRPHWATAKDRLIGHMQATMPDTPSVQQRDAHWNRQSVAAVALVHLGHGEEAWSLLEFTPDPSLRSFIIYHLSKLRSDHNTLAIRLEVEEEISIRRALVQSLGGLDSALISPADRRRITEHLLLLYTNDPDPGIHGSASWAVRKWGETLPELLVDEPVFSGEPRDARRRWYVNGQGQTMVVFPIPPEYGNSQIHHSFAISSHEVTVAEYRRFWKRHDVDRRITPTEDCPVYRVSWYMAAKYCNWLSQHEGISEDQWVYEPNDNGEYAEGMKIKKNFRQLRGYRFPTEAEWEHACRAGARGSYSFGEPVPLLQRYSQYVLSSSGRSHSVESLLPNDAGLFDMHGNMWEWTQSPFSGPLSPVQNNNRRVLRGGAYLDHPELVRSDFRINQSAGEPFIHYGFRPARTYKLSP